MTPDPEYVSPSVGRPEATRVVFDDLVRAHRQIAPHILATPLIRSWSLTETCGVDVYLKLEHHQITGSFKVRGATNAVLNLTSAERGRGVVAATTGNHGRAVAYAARSVGSHATICMSDRVPGNKVTEIRRLGATVVIGGESQDEAYAEAERLAVHDGLVMIPPFDHPDVVAGQGTLGLEIMDALPEVGTVVVPLSGGGLSAGVGLAVRGNKSTAKLVGVSLDRGAAMKESLEAQKPVEVTEVPSLGDSLGGGIGLQNKYTFDMCRSMLDEGHCQVVEIR
ncbi:threonine/serine dehydratase [Rhodococcus sp. WY5]|uniref:threonine/serine dehydratase n=1 Tax=Rhodococcus sp. WY5 TaxID=2708349 RepID=UPI001BDE05D7|nr:threonine/serine dehydratase [Rhodococcus sp. WY5]